MNAYILEDNAFSNDELAIYVLIESTEYDEGEYYTEEMLHEHYAIDCGDDRLKFQLNEMIK